MMLKRRARTDSRTDSKVCSGTRYPKFSPPIESKDGLIAVAPAFAKLAETLLTEMIKDTEKAFQRLGTSKKSWKAMFAMVTK